MKKIVLFICALAVTSVTMAQVDRSLVPKAGPAPLIKLSDYESFTLPNGLQVFLVENHKIPKISWRLFIDEGPVSDGEFIGLQSLTGQALKTGTQSRTKAQIDQEIDFIGARIYTSSVGAYATSLSKHKEKILSLMSDILLHPTFPEDEYEKLKKREISGLQDDASSPRVMSRNLTQSVNYGKDHPYGEIETIESIEKLMPKMSVEFYNTYFRPNISYLVIVGDISKKEAMSLVTENFGTWAKKDVPTHTYKMPTSPKANEVDFVDQPGAVQSTINITYPVDLKPGSDDAIAASVMNAILGQAGFMARLLQNLREDKAFTYGAYSRLSPDQVVGKFSAGAGTRNMVTDSAITEFLFEMDRLRNETVDAQDLQDIKNYMNGRFASSLEQPRTVANFALNIERYHLPHDYYATYLEKLQAVTAQDVQRMARKYITPNNAHITVVGNKAEVADKLKKFSANNTILYYDVYGNPIADVNPIPDGITPDLVLSQYFNAMGGKEKLMEITSQDMVMATSVNGMDIEVRIATKGENKMLMAVTSGEMNLQKIVINGEMGQLSGMGGEKELTQEEVKTYLSEAVIFEELDWNPKDMKLLHIEEKEGLPVYKMEVDLPDSSINYIFFDVKTGLKVSSIKMKKTPEGTKVSTSTYKDYTSENGIMYPETIIQDKSGQVMELKVKSIQMGGEIEDSLFSM